MVANPPEDMADTKALAITEEPAGGSPQPTSTPMWVGGVADAVYSPYFVSVDWPLAVVTLYWAHDRTEKDATSNVGRVCCE